MRRLSDLIGECVMKAIEGLETLQAAKDTLEWEVASFLGTDGCVHWLVGVGVPVSVTGDTEMPFTVLNDPHDQAEVTRLVEALYAKASGDAAAKTAMAAALASGHGKASRGPILP